MIPGHEREGKLIYSWLLFLCLSPTRHLSLSNSVISCVSHFPPFFQFCKLFEMAFIVRKGEETIAITALCLANIWDCNRHLLLIVVFMSVPNQPLSNSVILCVSIGFSIFAIVQTFRKCLLSKNKGITIGITALHRANIWDCNRHQLLIDVFMSVPNQVHLPFQFCDFVRSPLFLHFCNSANFSKSPS